MDAKQIKAEIKRLKDENKELEKQLLDPMSLLHSTRIGLQLQQNKENIKFYRKELKELG